MTEVAEPGGVMPLMDHLRELRRRLVIALIVGGAGYATMLSGSPPLDWNDALLLLLLPIAIALLATQVARGALMRAVRERL